jgi:DNA-binding beta-propeller fold protein YncE
MLRTRGLALALGAAALVTFAPGSKAQQSTNPYHVEYNWDKLEGRKIGVASGFKMDPDGKHLWVIDRCGANGCADSTLDPIIQVTLDGKFVKSFGKGVIGFPHGLFVDKQGNVWVTDGAPEGDPRAAGSAKRHIGHQVFKFSPDGKVLLTLGTAGVSGADQTHMNGPTGVVVQDNGTIWVTDGHGGPQRGPYKDNMYGSRGGNNRLIEFSPEGKFMKQWGGGPGSEGNLPMQFNDPHDIGLDAATGNMYIADRGNQRVQVVDKNGNFVTRWTQFGKPSAVAIDTKGHIYVADGMSDAHWNPGWERGIRIGDIKTGWVKGFIPDEEAANGAGTEFLGVDPQGNIYSGASSRPGLVLHKPFRPVD